MAETNRDIKHNGAAFDDFFESLGKKAEHLTTSDPASKSKIHASTPNGHDSLAENATLTDDADEQRVVDEIESLCMNCHENVNTPATYLDNRTLLTQDC